MQWLISEAVQVAMQSAPVPTAEQLTQLYAVFGATKAQAGRMVEPNASRVMTVVNNTAQVDVVGVMTSTPDFFATFFGGGNVLFGDLMAAIEKVEAEPAITQVDFFFKSGGGEAMPTAALGDAIAAMSTKTRAVVDEAQSAAFWAASQTDSILANSRGSIFGSIGVVTRAAKPSESFAVEVTSTEAPNKRPNPETPEGLRAIREQIDPMHDMFVDAVAKARGTTAADVNANFGRGGTLLAAAALEVGMIDAIESVAPVSTTKPTAETKIKVGAKAMNLETLKAEHPSLFAQVMAAGEQVGIDKERDRVKFHATMGANTGAFAFALKACLEGTGTQDGAATAEYMTAGINKNELDAREEDNKKLEGNNPAPADETVRESARVTNLFAQATGTNLGA